MGAVATLIGGEVTFVEGEVTFVEGEAPAEPNESVFGREGREANGGEEAGLPTAPVPSGALHFQQTRTVSKLLAPHWEQTMRPAWCPMRITFVPRYFLSDHRSDKRGLPTYGGDSCITKSCSCL
jgi:hypothetical protein